MSRFTAEQRRERREQYDRVAEIGELLLSVRDDGSFLARGFATWEAFLAVEAIGMVPARLDLTADQALEFVREALTLASRRRLGRRRAVVGRPDR